MNSWKRGFDVAKAASSYATAPKHSKRVGAALFSGANLLSIGFNSYGSTHPSAKWNIHAEHRAVIRRRYCGDKNTIIYVYRELTDGTPACSKPCSNCLDILIESGVRKIRYISDNREWKEISL